MAARLARRWRRSCGGIAAAAARETCPTNSGSNANGTVAQKYLLTESDPPPILCSLVSEYEQQLRQIHRNVHPHTEWASLSAKKRRTEGAEDETERLLSDATPLIAATRALPKGRIDVTAVMDANIHDPYRSKLASMEYSAGGELFMTASRNGRVSLFHMDGEENPLVDAMGIKDFTIIRAGFLPQKDKVPQSVHFSPSPAVVLHVQILVIGSPQFQSIQLLDLETKETERIFSQDSSELFHSFSAASSQNAPVADVVAFVGKGGTVPIYSFKSRQWIAKLQSKRPIESATFMDNTLYTCSLSWPIDRLLP